MATYSSYKKVASDAIVDLSVTGAKLVDTTVSTANLAANSVGTTELAATTVAASNIAAGEVGTTQLGATIDLSGKTVTYRTITNADISGTSAITTSKISGAITSIASNGLATSATTNTLNATNITSGSLSVLRGGQQNLTNGFSVHPTSVVSSAGTIAWSTSTQGHQVGSSSNTWQFDGSNQVVTVYQTGTYICMAEVITATSSGQSNMYIQVNGSSWTDFRGGDTISNHAAVSGAITMNLSANDNVRIYMGQSNGWHSGYYSRWSFTKLGGWS